MKTFDQRTADVLGKIEIQKRKQKTRRAAIAALSLCLVAAIVLPVLFVPFNTAPPDVSMYAGSPYYGLIRKLNKATWKAPRYKNNFERWSAGLEDLAVSMESAMGGDHIVAPDAMVPEREPADSGMNFGAPGDGYVEVTDNQVQGVIEGDLIKRTESHIFYLDGLNLRVYTIAGEDSRQVATYQVTIAEDQDFWLDGNLCEMYLSDDGDTVTLVSSCYGDFLAESRKEAFLCLVSLDVSDPEKIRENGRQYITGYGLSSRKVGDTFLVMSCYQILMNSLDFSKPETFLPRIGNADSMQCIAAENILAPEELTSLRYTVVTMLSEDGLTLLDSAALLSYSEELYVSRENIFATRSFAQNTPVGDKTESKAMTEISCLSYGAEGLQLQGSVTVEGTVKDQYSMDEHEKILRVVTSTRTQVLYTRTNGDNAWQMVQSRTGNVNLYCIDMTDWSIRAKVEAFAPENETAESVRFDGTAAYVCTAEVVTLTDPVYFFDLSDLDNITWKDTGVIKGYSSSLVNFGDYLLGIGFGEYGQLKIEVYQETADAVVSIASYELEASFSSDYKSYFIDRENNLIGLGVWKWTRDRDAGRYILLGFNGYALCELANELLDGSNDDKRGLVIDGWLYLFAEGEQFKTVNIR